MEDTGLDMRTFSSPRTWVVVLFALLLMLAIPPTTDEAKAAPWGIEYSIVSGNIIQEQCVAVDGDNIYIVYTRSAAGEYHLHLIWYDGEDWTAEQRIDSTSTNARFPDVAADKGVAHIAYVDSTDGDIDIKYVSFDGEDLSKPTQISDATEGVTANFHSIAVEGDEVHIVYERWSGGRDVMHRAFDGEKWGSITDVSTDSGDEDQTYPDVTVLDGTAHVVWEDRGDGDRDIYYRSLEDGTWSEEVEVSSDEDVENQMHPVVAATGSKVHVAYDQVGTNPTTSIHMTTFDGTWSTPAQVSEGTTPPQHYGAEIAAEDGHVALVYHKNVGVSPDVFFRHFDGTSWEAEEEISNTAADTDHYEPDVDLEDGQVHAIWHDYKGTGKFLKYRTADLSEDDPTAEVQDLDPYWIQGGSAPLHWTAIDDYSVTSVTIQYRYSADKGSWTDWGVASTVDGLWGTTNSGTATFNPSDGDGYYEFKAEATDRSGRTEPMSTDPEAEGAMDTTAPTGSILINDGDTATGETTVTLTLTHEDVLSGVYMIRLSDEPIVGDEPLLPAVETRSWELPDEGGEHTVYYQIRDGAAVFSQTYTATITIDRDAPTGSIALQGGATATNDATVTLVLTYDDPSTEVVGYRVSEEAIGGDEPWEDPVGTLEFTLAGEDGEKDIYFQVIDAAGMTSSIQKITVTLDTTNPYVDITDPEDGEKDMDVDETILVRFSERMDPEAVDAATELTWVDKDDESHDVMVDITWSPDGRTMTLAPTSSLRPGTEFLLRIDVTATDPAGNQLFPAVEYSYTTAGDAGDGGDGDDDSGVPLGLIIGLLVVIIVIGTIYYFVKFVGDGGGEED